MSDQVAAPPLSVRIGDQTQVLDPARGVAVIGRDPAAAVRIDDERISRSHVRLEPHPDGWRAIDTSTNGIFVGGMRRRSVPIHAATTIYLGNADGIQAVFTPDDPLEKTQVTGTGAVNVDDGETWTEMETTDPDVARAGRLVAARRRELDITQRSLARDKIINAGALIAFEKGRSWPRQATLAKLEEVLQWPPGTITRIRDGASTSVDPEVTEAVTNTVQAPLMAEAVELAMHTLTAAIGGLPKPTDPAFTPRATAILADLRKLEAVAANAARHAKGTPSVVLALSAVRRSYNDLMARAARSRTATLGQRLYGSRHAADLSVEETANAAGLSSEVIAAAEAERPIHPDAVRAIENLIAQLAG